MKIRFGALRRGAGLARERRLRAGTPCRPAMEAALAAAEPHVRFEPILADAAQRTNDPFARSSLDRPHHGDLVVALSGDEE